MKVEFFNMVFKGLWGCFVYRRMLFIEGNVLGLDVQLIESDFIVSEFREDVVGKR